MEHILPPTTFGSLILADFRIELIAVKHRNGALTALLMASLELKQMFGDGDNMYSEYDRTFICCKCCS